ncbi:MAG: hypothetical protein V1870_02190 [Candidatus Aenigmatarchaeota archaeon]
MKFLQTLKEFHSLKISGELLFTMKRPSGISDIQNGIIGDVVNKKVNRIVEWAEKTYPDNIILYKKTW